MKNWDKYFFDICKTVANNSKCLSRQLGAVMVRDKRIISTGYNGPPKGIPHCDERFVKDQGLIDELKKMGLDYSNECHKCPRQVMGFKSGEGLQWCLAGHAERNSLINAAALGHSTAGATIYMNCGVPCKDCLIEIINADIKELVIIEETYYDKPSAFLITSSQLLVRTFDIPEAAMKEDLINWSTIGRNHEE